MDVSSLLTGNNAGLIDQLYHQWSSDPSSVDPAWAELFAKWEDEEGYALELMNHVPPEVAEQRCAPFLVEFRHPS